MLCECHGHIMLNGVSYTEAVSLHENGPYEADIRKKLQCCADNGITFYRDGGDRYGVSAFARRISCEYGIDYRTPVYIIHKKGSYGRLFGKAYEDMTDYRTLVIEAKQQGADFIKITASGMLDFTGGGGVTGIAPPLTELRELVKVANGEGFSVMAHVNGAVNIKNALEAGVSSVEHGFYIDDEGLSMLCETGAVWVPTCAAVANLIGTYRYDDGILNEIMTKHYHALQKAYAMGALIASGSDAGAVTVRQGRGTLDEYAFLRGLDIEPCAGNRRIISLFRPR